MCRNDDLKKKQHFSLFGTLPTCTRRYFEYSDKQKAREYALQKMRGKLMFPALFLVLLLPHSLTHQQWGFLLAPFRYLLVTFTVGKASGTADYGDAREERAGSNTFNRFSKL